jgi:hypothetical protein
MNGLGWVSSTVIFGPQCFGFGIFGRTHGMSMQQIEDAISMIPVNRRVESELRRNSNVKPHEMEVINIKESL